ncbi:MAG: sulfatase-like hydrolase/transferase, partial [Myxococcota bacterium]
SRPGFRGMFIDQPYGGSFVPTVDNMRKAFEKKIQLDDADMRYITSLYDQGIRYTDTRLGVFIRYLMDQGYLDDTALIITSDHGEEFGEHGSTLHWQVFFQPNLRIPLIIRMPGGTSREIRIDFQVELIDLLPTILDWVGAEPLQAAQGTSFADTMAHAHYSWQGWMQRELARLRPDPTAYAWGAVIGTPWRSVLRGRFQLIFFEGAPKANQLFDIEADPFAQHNLAAENTHVVEQMREEGLRVMSADRSPDAEASTALDAESEEQLRALGYLQ